VTLEYGREPSDYIHRQGWDLQHSGDQDVCPGPQECCLSSRRLTSVAGNIGIELKVNFTSVNLSSLLLSTLAAKFLLLAKLN